MIKKALIAAGIAALVVFSLLLTNYVSNERFIDRYEKGIYENSEVTSILGFTQPYIYHYNQGNVYYENNDFEGAEEEYRKALESRLPGEYDCKTRINLALSMVTPIEADKVTKENLDETIELLEEAKDILIENGCAHRDDEDGHSEDAQKLKDEIDEFEEQLKQQVQQQSDENEDDEDSDGSDNPEDGASEDETDSDADEGDETRRQLEDLQEDSLQQRNDEMNEYGVYKDDYSYYDGKSW